MNNARFFTKLDASNAYWQIEVNEESSKLLTFNTLFRRFSFRRLPFGIHSASNICQLKISQILEGIEGVLNSEDDIIIWGSNKDELMACSTKVLTSIGSAGLKLNKDKCKFEVKATTFLGQPLKKGWKPTPQKFRQSWTCQSTLPKRSFNVSWAW